ncbi:MAG: hypothetical protein HC859_03090 [Bacteroidia bacterium]|nr:hypothetical protein [Bacteroidia bacterium]
MRTCIAILLLPVVFACARNEDPVIQNDRVLLVVHRDYRPLPKESESVSITLPWTELTNALPGAKQFGFAFTDQNFGEAVPYTLADSDGDGDTDHVVFNYIFKSNEPVFTFVIHVESKDPPSPLAADIHVDSRLRVELLTPYSASTKRYPSDTPVADRLVQSTMQLYPDLKEFPVYAPRRWNYEYSFFMAGAYKLGKQGNKPAYVNYVREWIDDFIAEEGGFKSGVYDMSEFKLDDVLPGRVALYMYEETKAPKYKSVADTLIRQLTMQPKTSDGGYWHKQVYPHQMWLDGIFMGDVFSMQYAAMFDQPQWFDEAVHQVELIYAHTYDSASGLMYHGWDESINPVWADPIRGTSPEFWGRAVGWYLVALVECLDYLPQDHPGRANVVAMLKQVAAGVKQHQDGDSKLWYQCLTKANGKATGLKHRVRQCLRMPLPKDIAWAFLMKHFCNRQTPPTMQS